MDFLPYIMKWLELALRWGHVLFAILWVGNSFLFNYWLFDAFWILL